MIYFDNAATTFPKPRRVLYEVNKCIKEYCGNHGRSSHRLALKTSEKIYEARERVAKFLNIPSSERIVFCENATHALNLAIKTTVNEGDHVLISDMEHNSVLRPVHALSKKKGVTYSVFETDGNISENIERLITKKTTCIISSLASNVNGKEISFKELSAVKRSHAFKLIADASQLIGHRNIDLKETGCDVLCAPSHKALFGIQGSGFAVFNDGCMRETLYEGGSGSDSLNPEMPENYPERFEAGTLPAPSIISLLYGIDFIESIGLSEIEKKLTALCNMTRERLLNIKGVKLYGAQNGVVAFNLSDIPSSLVSHELDRCGICTRSGLHCAPLAHKTLGTDKMGTVRASFSVFNTKREVDKLYKALSDINKKYK